MHKQIYFIIAIIIVVSFASYLAFFRLGEDSASRITNNSYLNVGKETDIENKLIDHPELGKIKLPKITNFPSILGNKKKIDNDINNMKTPLSSDKNLDTIPTDASIQITIQSDLNDDSNIVADSLDIIGFSKDGADAINSNNPQNLLSVNDMPEALKQSIKLELEKSKKNGFDDVQEKDADEITGILNRIVSTSTTVSNLSFKLSQIPPVIFNNYDYQGYTFPNFQGEASNKVTNDTVRRVFHRLDTSHLLIIEESSLAVGGATLIKEFVNTSVAGFPAIYAIKKSKSGKTYVMLNWITNTYSYSLYQVGSLENAKQVLPYIGNELSTLNSAKTKDVIKDSHNLIN